MRKHQKTLLEYVWLDKEGSIRSKARSELTDIIYYDNRELEYNLYNTPAPVWNFDGSSTGQNLGDTTETVLNPVRIYKNPFEKERSLIVLCELDLHRNQDLHPVFLDENGKLKPVEGFNCRKWASSIVEKHQHLKSWFGLEQEYTLVEPEGLLEGKHIPVKFDTLSKSQQGPFYCSVSYPFNQYEEIAREHAKMCLEIGIEYSGFNAEVLPSQWEFQIGPSSLLKAGDDLVIARYILMRLAKKHGVGVSFHPKPVQGWNGSGCHINFSTVKTRGENGYDEIMRCIKNLETWHEDTVKYYGHDNHLRLTGMHETSSMTKFTFGVGTRHTSIRIPNFVEEDGKGYFEDRRPASNIDPYLAMGKLLEGVTSKKMID